MVYEHFLSLCNAQGGGWNFGASRTVTTARPGGGFRFQRIRTGQRNPPGGYGPTQRSVKTQSFSGGLGRFKRGVAEVLSFIAGALLLNPVLNLVDSDGIPPGEEKWNDFGGGDPVTECRIASLVPKGTYDQPAGVPITQYTNVDKYQGDQGEKFGDFIAGNVTADAVIYAIEPKLHAMRGSLSLLNPSLKLGSFKVGKNLACLRSNLFAQSNPKTIEKLRHLTKGNKEFLEPKGYHEEEEFNSLDDCIYGIEEPLYSAAVRVYEEGPTDCVLEGTPKDYGNKYLPNCPADAPVLNECFEPLETNAPQYSPYSL